MQSQRQANICAFKTAAMLEVMNENVRDSCKNGKFQLKEISFKLCIKFIL